MMASLFGLAICAPLNYLFMTVLGFGYLGTAIVYNVTAWSAFVVAICYNLITGFHVLTWPKISKEVFNGWGEIMSISIYSILMLISEWWAFEVHAVLASSFGNGAIAAQVRSHHHSSFKFFFFYVLTFFYFFAY